jgi:hypothetical protein
LTSIATFPSDYSGNETNRNRRSADIIHFDYDKSHRNYEGVRPADEIHQFTLVFQHKNKAETHARTDGQEEEQTETSAETGYPIVDVTEEEWAYLHIVSEKGAP